MSLKENFIDELENLPIGTCDHCRVNFQSTFLMECGHCLCQDCQLLSLDSIKCCHCRQDITDLKLIQPIDNSGLIDCMQAFRDVVEKQDEAEIAKQLQLRQYIDSNRETMNIIKNKMEELDKIQNKMGIAKDDDLEGNSTNMNLINGIEQQLDEYKEVFDLMDEDTKNSIINNLQ